MSLGNGRARVLVPVNESTIIIGKATIFSELQFDVVSNTFVIFTRQMTNDKLVEAQINLKLVVPEGLPNLTRRNPTSRINLPIPDKMAN